MVNKIVTDSFETLGGTVKQVGDDIAENLGLKPADSAGTSEQTSQQQQQMAQDDKVKKMDDAGKKKATARYRELQEEIKQLEAKRSREMVKYNEPGFTDDQKQQNQIKQLEEKKEKKLPPLPVQRASKKTESLRGVSG